VQKRTQKGSQSLAASLLVRQWRTSLRSLQRVDASESREVYAPLRGAPPNRFPTLCCAARQREMAKTEKDIASLLRELDFRGFDN
jgi:hypothetical protein